MSAENDLERLSRIATTNLTVAMQLRATAWALTEAGLRMAHPEWDETAIQAEVRNQFLRTAG
jgi:hypothetical protein